jgi:hypothetical protein
MYVCMYENKIFKMGHNSDIIYLYKKKKLGSNFYLNFFPFKIQIGFIHVFVYIMFVVISDMCTVLYIRDPCNSPRCVLSSLFSVGTYLDFQILTMVGFSKIFKSHKIK